VLIWRLAIYSKLATTGKGSMTVWSIGAHSYYVVYIFVASKICNRSSRKGARCSFNWWLTLCQSQHR